jgi:putative acetyltransferase
MVFEVRPEQPADRAVVRRVVAAAFSADDPAHGEEVADIWDGLGRHRRLGLVAGEPGEDRIVVGHVGLSRAWLDARRELVDVWVLSPLSVEPGRQGSGIGTALVAAALDAAREAGVPALFLEGSPDYYGARGFERADRLGLRPPALERTPAPAFQVATFDAYRPWMTGQLVYPSTWWEHEAAGLRDPFLAEVEERVARD